MSVLKVFRAKQQMRSVLACIRILQARVDHPGVGARPETRGRGMRKVIRALAVLFQLNPSVCQSADFEVKQIQPYVSLLNLGRLAGKVAAVAVFVICIGRA